MTRIAPSRSKPAEESLEPSVARTVSIGAKAKMANPTGRPRMPSRTRTIVEASTSMISGSAFAGRYQMSASGPYGKGAPGGIVSAYPTPQGLPPPRTRSMAATVTMRASDELAPIITRRTVKPATTMISSAAGPIR